MKWDYSMKEESLDTQGILQRDRFTLVFFTLQEEAVSMTNANLFILQMEN